MKRFRNVSAIVTLLAGFITAVVMITAGIVLFHSCGFL